MGGNLSICRANDALPSGSAPPLSMPASDLRARARAILKLRRARERVIDPRLFGEPSWDMLLELYVAHCDGKRVNVSALAHASGAPTTTGLRYISLLGETGLVERTKAAQDRRAVEVMLTAHGLATIERLLATYTI